MKTSSRKPDLVSSRSSQPCPATRRRASPRISRPRGDSTTNREATVAPPTVSTEVTPGRLLSDATTASRDRPLPTSTRAAGKTCSPAQPGCPWPPRGRIDDDDAVADHGDFRQDCVERDDVCWPPRRLYERRGSPASLARVEPDGGLVQGQPPPGAQEAPARDPRAVGSPWRACRWTVVHVR